MERKRIILLATSDINYDQRLIKIANALHSFGAYVHLLGRSLPTSIELKDRDYSQKRINCIFNKGALFYLEINIRYFFKILFQKWDVVVSNDADTLLSVYLASYFKNFTWIHDAHEYFSEVPELSNKPFKKKIWFGLEKKSFKKIQVSYTVNKSIAQLYKNAFLINMYIIKNVPNAYEVQKNKEHSPIILYQGALNKERGLVPLIKAMKDVPAVLHLAGKGDLEANLKLLVQNEILEHKVKFLGNLLPEDLKIITQKATIGINLLEGESLNYYYSLANKFFDYMHAELPQISMNYPEYLAINTQFPIAILINKATENEIKEALLNLLKNENLYKEMEQACMQAKKEFTWEKEQVKLKEIYGL